MVNLDLPILNRVKNILTKTEKIDTDVASVLTKLSEQGVDIDSIVKNIGTSGDQADVATLFGKLAELASKSGGAIKSVQRGTYKGSALGTPDWQEVDKNVTIRISAVNPEKCTVYFRERYISVDERAANGCTPKVTRTSLQALNTNSIVIKQPYYRRYGLSDTYYTSMEVDWEVIEFC